MDPQAAEITELRKQVLALRQDNEALHRINQLRKEYISKLEDQLDVFVASKEHDILDPPIFRLPDELLSMIVDHYSDDDGDLKTLRFVHSRLAYLRRTMQLTFNEVVFYPRKSTYQWDHDECQALAPYVRTVKFQPVTIKQEYIVLREGVLTEGAEHAWGERRRFLNRHLTSEYMPFVLLKHLFVDALKLFKRVEKVRIDLPDDDPRSEYYFDFPETPSLYSLMIEVVARAAIRPVAVDLDFLETTLTDTSFHRFAYWPRLDLSQLRTLSIVSGDARSNAEQPEAGLASILTKCAPTLQHLKLEYMEYLFKRPHLALPALRKLEMVCIGAMHIEFAKWVGSLPALEELSIHEDMRDHRSCGWVGFQSLRPLFDSIRNRPLKVTFSPLRVPIDESGLDSYKFSLKMHTQGTVEDAVFEETGDIEMDRQARVVIAYLANAGE